MALCLALDVYGTLIDTAGVISALQTCAGERAAEFAQRWRDKQLEYSFRRALMRQYVDFSICTAQAFDHTSEQLGLHIDSHTRAMLLYLYRHLPAFGDTSSGLARLASQSLQLYAFSNGRASDVHSLLDHADIAKYFVDVISLEEIATFKPDPLAYTHFLTRAEAFPEESWLISSNPFDVIGAKVYGLNAMWIKRSASAVYDPWDIEPDAIVRDLDEAASFFARLVDTSE